MACGSQLRPPFQVTKNLLYGNGKNLTIEQPSILEIKLLYEAIQDNIKIVNQVFTEANKY